MIQHAVFSLFQIPSLENDAMTHSVRYYEQIMCATGSLLTDECVRLRPSASLSTKLGGKHHPLVPLTALCQPVQLLRIICVLSVSFELSACISYRGFLILQDSLHRPSCHFRNKLHAFPFPSLCIVFLFLALFHWLRFPVQCYRLVAKVDTLCSIRSILSTDSPKPI